uniref:DUF7083 domain-containing protein n=1 Tax=Anopheles dirus TaxID=7168 RepID=A0A182NDP2_9DIPT
MDEMKTVHVAQRLTRHPQQQGEISPREQSAQGHREGASVLPPSFFAPPPSQINGSSAPPCNADGATMMHMFNMPQQQMASQQQMINQILNQQLGQTAGPLHFQPEQAAEALASSMTEFWFDADAGITFQAWLSRYDDLFKEDACRLNDSE